MQGVVILMFSQVIIKIVGLVYKLYLTNKQGFGDRGNAIYSAAFQIYALFLTVSSIAVPNSISKLISSKVAIGDNKGAYRIFKIAFAMFGILGFIGSSILFFKADKIANTYLQIPEAKLALIAISPSIFLVSIEAVLKGYFNGRDNISVTANSQSLEQVFKTLVTIIVVEYIGKISGNNTMVMAAGATLATTLATLFTLIYLYKYFVHRKKGVWQEVISSTYNKKETTRKIIKNILLVSIPISLSALFSAASKTIDAMTVVRILKTTIGEVEATNQYGILSGKVDTLIALPFSFNIAFATALVPAISSAMAKKQKEIANKRIEFSILVTILIGLFCTVYMCMFARDILYILFPNASKGAKMLQLSSFTIIFIVLTQTINGALQGLGKVNVPVVAFAIGGAIKLILNLVLIPINKIGIYGTIISSIVSDICIFIICFMSLRKNLESRFSINKFIIKPLISAIIMASSSYLIYSNLKYKIQNSLLILVSTILLGTLIYIFLIFIFKILSKEEIFMLPYGQKVFRTLEDKKTGKAVKSTGTGLSKHGNLRTKGFKKK